MNKCRNIEGYKKKRLSKLQLVTQFEALFFSLKLCYNVNMESFKKALKEIDQIFAIYRKKQSFNIGKQKVLYEKLRLEWTYNSNAIEGNSLSLDETAFYLREGLTSKGKPLIDYLEAKNHAEAIDWLFDFIKKKKPIGEGFIKGLNALLHRGITERLVLGFGGEKIMRKINPGVYKKNQIMF